MATDVAGRAVIPVLVSARENILDRDKYGGARSIDLDTFDPEPAREPAAVAA